MRRRAFSILLCIVVLLLPACASPLTRLPAEREVPRLAALLDRVDAHRNDTYLVPTQLADESPVRIAVHETGAPSSDRVLVLIHGVFTDSTTWRYVQGALVDDYELWLIDLPGCGLSDIPDAGDLPPYGYSPEQIAERVLQALDARLAGRNEGLRLALIGHSLGGQVAIQMMTDPRLVDAYDHIVARIDRVALLAPADVDVVEPDPLVLQLIGLQGWKVNMAADLGMLQRRVVDGTRKSVTNKDLAVRESAQARIDILRDPARRRALQSMLRDSVPSVGYTTLDREAIAREVADYERMRVPCLIIWGAQDDALSVQDGYKLAGELPTAELIVFDGPRHGVHHEEPEQCAVLIAAFIEAGRAPLPEGEGVRLAVDKPPAASDAPIRRLGR